MRRTADASPPAPGTQTAAHPLGIDFTEFRLAWRIAVLATLGLAINSNSAMLYAFGALVVPLQQAFSWERAELQTAVSFLFMGSIVSAQVVGWLNLRFGMRRVTVASLIALSLSYVALTRLGPSIVQLYVLLFVVSVSSMGTMHVTWTYLTNLWFERNRGLALALVLSGTGLAAMAVPVAISAVVTRWNWQAAFWLMAAMPVVLVLPLVLAWMKEPADKQRAPATAGPVRTGGTPLPGLTLAQGLRSPRFWLLNLALSLVVACIVAMVTSGVPLLRDKGLDATDAARIFGGFGLSLIVGRVVAGYLVDRLWAPAVAGVALSLPALGCLLLRTADASDTAQLVVGVMLVGIGSGAEVDVAAFLMSRYFGLRDYGRLFGIHLSLITLASTLAPWLFGLVYRSTGSYDTMLLICGLLFLGGGLSLLALGRYPTFTSPHPGTSTKTKT
ncbi:MFS transporter [Caldimonas thermodepolymerans]|jgi:MFS family permease|uniref:MFS transporter n=1 Tax=Caldimonas thermodepolymerans TaxID=215580 RepID=UPI0022357E78|nr:MFS transporter [Caldimonas thermodepolymerans]UZG46076.1 MFS transporter [Caldimonas thermodepolymerans]